MAGRVLDPVECSLQPLDLAFHPTDKILAVGLVDGTVEFHDYSLISSKSASIPDDDDDTILSSIEVHVGETSKFKSTTPLGANKTSSSCRAITFNPSGDILYTASNGGCIAAIDVKRASYHRTSDYSILWKINNASPHGITAIYHMNHSDFGECLVTGDEEGVVRIWDIKKCENAYDNNAKGPGATSTAASAFDNCLSLPPGCISSFVENTDYISSFQVDASCNILLASSADGVLTVIDLIKSGGKKKQAVLKKGIEPVKINPKTVQGPFRVHRKSDDQEDELLSMCLMKHGKKVVCGTQQGVLNFWSWGTWGDISDRFPGHPQSIDTLLKIDEDTLLTGSGDGVVRILQVQPDQLLGVLGDHEGFPVEKLKFGIGNKIVGSISHDCNIRMWDASILCEDGEEDDADMDGMDSEAIANKVAKAATKGGAENSEDEWEDADSDDSMEDSDSDSDDGKKGKKTRKFKTENDNFFSDL